MGREKAERAEKRKHRHSSSSSRHRRRHDDSSSPEGDDSGSEDVSGESSGESYSESSDSEEEHQRKTKKARRTNSTDDRKTSSTSGRRGSKHGSSKRSKVKRKEKEERGSKSKKTKPVVDPISEEEYFTKSTEFRAWLADEKKIFFSDLTSEKSRKLFKKFVSKWNNGRLKQKYYQDIQSSSLGHSSQTQYKWKFAAGLNEKELQSMRESVTSWTTQEELGKQGGSSETQRMIGPSRPGQPSPPHIGPVQGPSRPPVNPFEEEERWQGETGRLRKERKDLRKHHEMVLDELLPKATGREAMFEKRRARAENRKGRDTSPDVKESILMGSSSADISRKIQARQEHRSHRAQAAHQKITDYQAKEKERVAAILEMAKANKKEGALW